MINVNALTLSYQDNLILKEITTDIPHGKISILIGANGCGKSTLLKSMANLLSPLEGNVLLNQQNIHKMPRKKLGQQLAVLSQSLNTTEDISVEQLVRYGRYPYHNLISRWNKDDEYFVQQALSLTQMTDLADQSLLSLSGGQKQRAWIAMTLAQNTPYIFLDEPTTYLDLTYQIEILSLLKSLNQQSGKTILMVLHDINLAARFADHIIAIKEGKIWTAGAPNQIITESMIYDVFGLKSQIIQDPFHQTPLCIPLSN